MTGSHQSPFSVINLGGEGEAAGIINQQRPAALSPTWGAALTGLSLADLAGQGHDFLICPNTRLPINDDSMDQVITNSVPIAFVLGEPGVQSSEVLRILKPGGQWVHDGVVRYTKP